MWLSPWQHSIRPQHKGKRREEEGVVVLWRVRGGRDECLHQVPLKRHAASKAQSGLRVSALTVARLSLHLKKRGSCWRITGCIWKDLLWRMKTRRGGQHVALFPPLLLGNWSSTWRSWSLWWQPQLAVKFRWLDCRQYYCCSNDQANAWTLLD